ncbi:MAG: hypothetical protein ACREWG_09820, partial [Gammaproteobacteria bacterium]
MRNTVFRVIAFALVLLGASTQAMAQVDLITNGGFESGGFGWNLTGSFQADSRFPNNAHGGSGYAYLNLLPYAVVDLRPSSLPTVFRVDDVSLVAVTLPQQPGPFTLSASAYCNTTAP